MYICIVFVIAFSLKVINFSWHLTPWLDFVITKIQNVTSWFHEQMWWYYCSCTAWHSKEYKNYIALHGRVNNAHMFSLPFQISAAIWCHRSKYKRNFTLDFSLCSFYPITNSLKQFMFIQIPEHRKELYAFCFMCSSASGNSESIQKKIFPFQNYLKPNT